MYESSDNSIVRYVPNMLSGARLLLSLIMLQLRPFSAAFISLYLACGVTDVLDGHIARKHHVESEFGAKLDSAADMTFFAVVLYVILSAMAIPVLLVLWAFVLIALRAVGFGMSYVRFKTFAVLHTYANKVTGFCFFVFPIASLFLGVGLAGGALCGIATYATAEEIYINAKSSELDLDIKSARYLNAPR